tara:strand:+ start:38 stop:298 length:261 start_codon:yes stop_codon:yes gene_type:complete
MNLNVFSKSQIEDQIKRIMSEVFDIPDQGSLEDASVHTIPEWDSIAHMALIVALEDDLDLTFNPQEIIQMTTIRDIQQILSTKLNQ